MRSRVVLSAYLTKSEESNWRILSVVSRKLVKSYLKVCLSYNLTYVIFQEY